MKKLICIILALMTFLTLVSCQPTDEPVGSSPEASASEETPEETPEETEPETEPPVSTLKINGADISEYTIVYGTDGENGEEAQAARLAGHFNSFFGCDIKAETVGDANLKKTITIREDLPPAELVGINRYKIDTATALILHTAETLWISASNKYTLEAAVDKLIADSTPAEAGETIELDYSGDNAASVVAESLGEMLRVMSYNVKTGSVSRDRCDEVMKNITDFMPDTIGTQEINYNWIAILKLKKFFDEYEMVGKPREKESDTSAGNEYSSIFYRKSTMNLIDSGTYWLSDTPTVVGSRHETCDYTRIMTFAVLERKSDGARFIHVNTHMEWDHGDVKTNLIQMKIMLDIVDKEIYSKHGELPTFFTGDFNVTMTSDGYKHIISTGKEDARAVADVTNDKITFPGKPGKIIDYCILSKGDFQVATFDVGVDLPGSDHQPVYVEMYITPQDN